MLKIRALLAAAVVAAAVAVAAVPASAGASLYVPYGSEALVEGDKDYLCAEPEIVIGELDGPVGTALATLVGDQVKGHTRVFAILNSDVQVRPATLMVSKVTVKDPRYTSILMGSVQAGIAHGVLDAVRAGDIPKKKVNDLGIGAQFRRRAGPENLPVINNVGAVGYR